MATITVDGNRYEVADGQNLLQACLSLGLNLPYFCWHPALGSVGACRQCALIQYQDADDRHGRLVMGCMTPVADAQILSIKAENAVNFRAGVIEALMTNHPHDCPVCEEGGECHLQDMTVMSGHHRRRYQGLKRTFANQQLGPFIRHEMNRCITCYRCLRYYRDYAGGDDLHALALRNKTYFGRFEDGTLESEFSGNLVEVCPTGVFTDRTLSGHYSRKWDLQCAPSVCVHCSLGCNTSPGERYGVLKRIQNRYHSEINGYFLCDRGRFGYGFVNHPQRPRAPVRRQNGASVALSASEGIHHLSKLLVDKSIRWIGIGSPRATLESNLALQRLVGNDHFFSGLSRQAEALDQALLKLLRSGHGQAVSLQQVERADALLILGEDITHTAPRLALSVRQAVRAAGRAKAAAIDIPPWQDQAVQVASQHAHQPLYLSHNSATKLDSLARDCYFGSALDQARLGFAVAHAIDPGAPAVDDLSGEQQALAERIARDLSQARQPLLIAGVSAHCAELIEATEQILAALQRRAGRPGPDADADAEHPRPWLSLVFDECNSLGLALLNHRGQENCLDDAFGIAEQSKTGAIILENDLYTRAPEAQVEAFFDQLDHCVVIDYLPSRTLAQAELLLPAASFAEAQGVLVNNEGRGQALFPVYPAPEAIKMGWQWLHDAMPGPDSPLAAFSSPAAALTACIEAEPMLAALAELITPENRFHGVKIARMSPRSSGRTALTAQISVHEPKQPQDQASALAYTMEGLPATVMARDLPAGLMPYSWFPGWNSNQSIHKFQQEIDGIRRGAATGVRLRLHSQPDQQGGWQHPPAPLQDPGLQQLLLIPQRQIFGSDELSNQAAAVAERRPAATLSLHPEAAKLHNIKPGDLLQVSLQGRRFQLPVTLNARQGQRLLLVPDGHPAMLGCRDPAWVSVRALGPDPVIATDRRDHHA